MDEMGMGDTWSDEKEPECDVDADLLINHSVEEVHANRGETTIRRDGMMTRTRAWR